MPIKDWSTTDADNDDADLARNIDWREGQSPATVNNSARAMMTQLKRLFTETAGGTVFVTAANVGGTANAITLTTDQTAAYAAGQRYMFIAESANTGAVTINKDSEGVRAVKSHGEPLVADAWAIGDVVIIADDGTDYELIYPRRQMGVDVIVVNDDAGAAGGPFLTLDRNSASPAASDLLGEIDFRGRDSGGNTAVYAALLGIINSPTDPTETGILRILTRKAGSLSPTLNLALGIYTPNATGTDKGVDTINASGVYDDGLLLRGTPIARLEDQKTSGTDGGTFTSGADRTRELNTEVYDPYSLVSISANQFTLAAGTWLIRWSAPAYRTNSHQSFLYDITGVAEVKRGTTEIAENLTGSESENVQGQTRSEGAARVTLASANVYEIRHRASATTATSGFGLAAGFGTEVYAWVEIYAA